jgi:hypothetical protein
MTNNIVYSYYQQLPGWEYPSELIQLWAHSWLRCGWTPVVLDERHASRHPDWSKFRTFKVNAFVSRNPYGYDLSCWARWLAFSHQGGGMMTDYDVINLSLSPNDPELAGSGPHILEQHRVPCAVQAGRAAADGIAAKMMAHAPNPRDDHYSDMYFFQDSLEWPHSRLCREYNGVEWENGKLIHLATGACRRAGKDKVALAKELLR